MDVAAMLRGSVERCPQDMLTARDAESIRAATVRVGTDAECSPRCEMPFQPLLLELNVIL